MSLHIPVCISRPYALGCVNENFLYLIKKLLESLILYAMINFSEKRSVYFDLSTFSLYLIDDQGWKGYKSLFITLINTLLYKIGLLNLFMVHNKLSNISSHKTFRMRFWRWLKASFCLRTACIAFGDLFISISSFWTKYANKIHVSFGYTIMEIDEFFSNFKPSVKQ